MAKVICPQCGRDMRLIGGEFYGCSGYPKDCKKTLSKAAARQYTVVEIGDEEKVKAKFTPSRYQQAVFDVIEQIDLQPSPHLVIEAVAGSGKTTTQVQSIYHIPNRSSKRVISVAFARNIAETLAERLPPDAESSTTHSAAFKDVRAYLGFTPKIDEYKVSRIAETILMPQLAHVTAQLVSKVKNTLAPVDFGSLDMLCDKYDIDIAAELPETASDEQVEEARYQVYNAIPTILERDLTETTTIDFDDMLWLPVYGNWPIRKFDWLMGDEVQDWNAGQIEWAMRAAGDGHVIAVGDSRQSIFGFRGADSAAMNNVTTRLQAQTLPLSICYRCPRTHIELAQQIVPTIEAAPNAVEGVIGWLKQYELTYHDNRPRGGDLVLCRVNAPLISYAYAFMRQGIKVTVRGRKLGEGIVALIRKLKPNSLDELAFKVRDYYDREYAKLIKKGLEGRAGALTERIETLLALIEGVNNLNELLRLAESMFNDNTKDGIVFSTVHRAKGDEADRVFILRPDLIPHPKAKREDQLEQEYNLKYVSLTRAKQELWFVEK